MSRYSIPENREDINEDNLAVLDTLAKLAYMVNSTIDWSASGNLDDPYSTDELCLQFIMHLYGESESRWSNIVVDIVGVVPDTEHSDD